MILKFNLDYNFSKIFIERCLTHRKLMGTDMKNKDPIFNFDENFVPNLVLIFITLSKSSVVASTKVARTQFEI